MFKNLRRTFSTRTAALGTVLAIGNMVSQSHKRKLLKIHTPEILPSREGWMRFGAKFELGDTADTIWFEVPEEHHDRICADGEPFVRALFSYASFCNADVEIATPLSNQTLLGIRRWLSVYTEWFPKTYHSIDVRSEGTLDSVPAGNKTLFTFSGGADSLYTVYRNHVSGLWSPYKLSDAVLIHGFDIKLEKEKAFDMVIQQSKSVLEPVGLGLIPVRTNLHKYNRAWNYEFNTALSAVLMSVGAESDKGLIAGTGRTGAASIIPHGSTPFTDPLLSSSRLEVVNSDWEASRMDKIEALRNWPEGIKYLRVCYSNPDATQNCGRCEKCVRTMMEFYFSTGSVPDAFDQPLTPEAILRPKYSTEVAFEFLNQISELASRNGFQGPELDAVRKARRRSRSIMALKRIRGVRDVGQKLRQIGLRK
jgi:hypothetical protein